jgi:hypothetical protein
MFIFRFTEFFVDDMDNREDLKLFVASYLSSSFGRIEVPVETVVDFYLAARSEATTNLTGFFHTF